MNVNFTLGKKDQEPTEYQKNLNKYNKMISELKDNRAKISQKINNWNTSQGNTIADSQLDYQNKIGVGLFKKMMDSVSGLTTKGSNIDDVYGLKKTTIDDINRVTDLQGDELDLNLGTFRGIESDISTRSRLVELNQDAYLRKEKNITALKTFFILALIDILLLASWRTSRINGFTFTWSILGGLITYSIYLIWYLNIFGVKSFSEAAIQDFEILADDVKNGVKIVRGDIARGIFGQLPDANCPTCPSNGKSVQIIPSNGGNKEDEIIKNDNAFWYYDGSLVPEKIVPMDSSMIDRQVQRGKIPKPRWEVRPNSCLLDWKKKRNTDLPKPSYSDTETGECIPWRFTGGSRY